METNNRDSKVFRHVAACKRDAQDNMIHYKDWKLCITPATTSLCSKISCLWFFGVPHSKTDFAVGLETNIRDSVVK